MKIRVRDIAEYSELHVDKLIALPGVRQVRSFFVMREIEGQRAVPVLRVRHARPEPSGAIIDVAARR